MNRNREPNEFHPRLRPDPDYDVCGVILAGKIAVQKRLATIERILRNERPRGVMPETLDAKPKNRGTTPRYEYWGSR